MNNTILISMSTKINRKPGQRNGRLVLVAEALKDAWGGRQFIFKCDCGKTVTTRWGITTSCGCAQRDFVRNKLNYEKRMAYGESCFNIVYARYKSSATYRKRDFNLTKSQFKALICKPCVYCGQLPTTVESHGGYHGKFVYNGLDRVDNSVGYSEDNVVPCCRTCNTAKRTMTVDEFKQWIDRVYKFLHT